MNISNIQNFIKPACCLAGGTLFALLCKKSIGSSHRIFQKNHPRIDFLARSLIATSIVFFASNAKIKIPEFPSLIKTNVLSQKFFKI